MASWLSHFALVSFLLCLFAFLSVALLVSLWSLFFFFEQFWMAVFSCWISLSPLLCHDTAFCFFFSLVFHCFAMPFSFAFLFFPFPFCFSLLLLSFFLLLFLFLLLVLFHSCPFQASSLCSPLWFPFSSFTFFSSFPSFSPSLSPCSSPSPYLAFTYLLLALLILHFYLSFADFFLLFLCIPFVVLLCFFFIWFSIFVFVCLCHFSFLWDFSKEFSLLTFWLGAPFGSALLWLCFDYSFH